MKFSAQIKQFSDKTKAKAETVVRTTVIELGRRLVEKSPVGNRELWASNSMARREWRVAHGRPELKPEGYVGGRFRGNWQYGNLAGIGIPTGTLDVIDQSGALTIGSMVEQVASAPAATVHFLANNLPYAHRLEDGWSGQAPEGMVAITLLEFDSIVSAAIAGVK